MLIPASNNRGWLSGVGDSIKSWFSPGFREEEPAGAGDQEQEKKEGEDQVGEIIQLGLIMIRFNFLYRVNNVHIW